MSRVKQALKRVALFILWPVRRFFDPRFAGIASAMQANIHATIEATEMLGRSLDELQARVDARFEEQQRHSRSSSARSRPRETRPLTRAAAISSGWWAARSATSTRASRIS